MFGWSCILTLVSVLSRDGGWIRTLLEEAENERMHLLTFMKVCAFFFGYHADSTSDCSPRRIDPPTWLLFPIYGLACSGRLHERVLLHIPHLYVQPLTPPRILAALC